jgi:uncharacterized protein YcfL
MTILVQTVLLWSAISLAAGCASNAPAPRAAPSAQPVEPSRPVAHESDPANDTRVILDKSLDRALRVLGVKSSTGPDGLLKIQVIVRNISDATRSFTYRIEWFDVNGALLPMASDDSLPWMLLAGETSSFVATAPAVTAKDFGVAFLPEAK